MLKTVDDTPKWLEQQINEARTVTLTLAQDLMNEEHSPAYTLEWSEGAFNAAARLRYLKGMQKDLTGRRAHVPDESEEKALEALVRHYTHELLSRSQSPTGSSGFCHRAMDRCFTGELAKLLRDIRFRLGMTELTVGISA